MKLDGSQIIVKCLIEQGVDVIFGYPGGAVLNIYDAVSDLILCKKGKLTDE
jgi:acetolactate synthase-1/2/3 large subunit